MWHFIGWVFIISALGTLDNRVQKVQKEVSACKIERVG
jgi:hypothetical protein